MLNYNAPNGSPSSIDANNPTGQMNTFFWLKKSLIEARKEQFFMPLASVTNMPKNFGKEIRVHEYVPLLDDRNINDQGLDANGATMDPTQYRVAFAQSTYVFAVEADADNLIAAINAVEAGVASKSGVGPWTVTLTHTTLAPTTNLVAAQAAADLVAGTRILRQSGNLYGSSRDIGTISAKLPRLGEEGGRVNRVGFTRLTRTGRIEKMGFFYEFTQESLDFDSDDQLKEHLARELMSGAVQLTEAVLQRDLLNAAGTVLYPGVAAAKSDLTGQVGSVTEISYALVQRLDQMLTNKRTPRQTKLITGSRYIDTKTIPAARYAFVGPALTLTLKNLKDGADKVFIPVQHYADAGTVANGEIGSIDAFRIIEVPEMLHWAGEGAVIPMSGANGYRTTNNHFDVYPFLVVGDESFTTIGFQTDGKSLKFNVKTVMPSENHSSQDPYGETGFSSIKWYYGTLILRPERIGMIYTVAKV